MKHAISELATKNTLLVVVFIVSSICNVARKTVSFVKSKISFNICLFISVLFFLNTLCRSVVNEIDNLYPQFFFHQGDVFDI